MLELVNILPVDVHTSLLSLGWGGVGVELWQSFEPHVEQPVKLFCYLLDLKRPLACLMCLKHICVSAVGGISRIPPQWDTDISCCQRLPIKRQFKKCMPALKICKYRKNTVGSYLMFTMSITQTGPTQITSVLHKGWIGMYMGVIHTHLHYCRYLRYQIKARVPGSY